MSTVLPWLEPFVWAILVPALVSAVILWLFPRRKGADRVAGALALAAGFFAGYFAVGHLEGLLARDRLADWTPLVPTSEKEEWSWLPWLALPAGLAGLAPLLPLKKAWLRWGVTALAVLGVAGAAAWLLVPNYEALQPTRRYYLGGTAGATFLLWAALAPLAERQPGGRVPLLLACVATAAAAVILLAASLKFAELAGPLAGALGGCALVAFWKPDRQYLRGMLPGFAVLLVGLLLHGHLGGSVEVPLSFLLVLVAPLLLWVGGRGRWGGWLQAAAVLLPLAAAVTLAALSAEGGGGEEDWSAAPVGLHGRL